MSNPIDLGQFVTGAETIKPADGGFAEPDAGVYKYTIKDLRTFKSKDNSRTFIALDFILDNGMTWGPIWELPKVYGQETQKERDTISRYLRTLADIGVENPNKPLSADDIKGWTGSLTIVKSPAKDSSGRVFTNARNITPTPVGTPSRTTADAAFIPAPQPQSPVQPAATTVASANPFE